MSIFSDNSLDVNDMQVQAEIKAISKAVGKSLAGDGHKVPHSVVLHAISAALAQRNWHQLKAVTDKAAGAGQGLASASVERASAQVLASVDAAQELPRLEDLPGEYVEATFYTDDRVFEVKFDARTFMATATDEQLNAIYTVGFGGDYCTDDVADHLATYWGHTPEGAQVRDAFAYLGLRNEARNVESVGFECRLDGHDFMTWLGACRPSLTARMLCNEYGVSISQSQDEGDFGKWTWWHEGEGCEVSFDTEQEAQLDAYRACALLEQELERLCNQ